MTFASLTFALLYAKLAFAVTVSPDSTPFNAILNPGGAETVPSYVFVVVPAISAVISNGLTSTVKSMLICPCRKESIKNEAVYVYVCLPALTLLGSV